MSIEIKVASFPRQVLIAICTFAFCAAVIISVKLFKNEQISESVAEQADLLVSEERETVIERDVEVNYLEPFLKRIGFNRTDWVRQLPVRVGRGNKYPDYVVNVTGSEGEYKAEYVWEAKYSIPTENQLRVDYGQARSYALLLQSRVMGLVSKEGVWFVTKNDQYAFDKIKFYSWEELKKDSAYERLKEDLSIK